MIGIVPFGATMHRNLLYNSNVRKNIQNLYKHSKIATESGQALRQVWIENIQRSTYSGSSRQLIGELVPNASSSSVGSSDSSAATSREEQLLEDANKRADEALGECKVRFQRVLAFVASPA